MTLDVYGGPCEEGPAHPICDAPVFQTSNGPPPSLVADSSISERSLLMSHDYFVPSVLHRHRRPVRALLIDDQA